MTLTETQVSYDRRHAAWAVKAAQSTVDRWVDAGVLHPSVRRSTGSGCGPHLFSPDDVRLAAMLNQFMIPGQKIGHEIRCALSFAWYFDGPCEFVVLVGTTVQRADSAEDAVAIVARSRGVATVLWPDRLLGWA